MLKKYRIRDYDFKLVIMLIAISVIGILAIGSAEKSVQDKQIMGLVMGVFLMIIISLFDYTALLNLYYECGTASVGGTDGFQSRRCTAMVFHFGNSVSAVRTCKNPVDFVLCTVYYETEGEIEFISHADTDRGIVSAAAVSDLSPA